MSSEETGFAGLFIPIGRRSRSPSAGTSSTGTVATASSVAHAESASVTETSSIGTTETSFTAKSATFIPSSGVRYTISSPSTEAYGYHSQSLAGVTNPKALSRSDGECIRQYKEPLAPSTVPAQDEPATGVSQAVGHNPIDSFPVRQRGYSETRESDSGILHEQVIHITPTTPFTSPEPTPNLAKENTVRNAKSPANTSAHLTTTLPGRSETTSNSRSTPPSRTPSRGSSTSSRNRVHPPGSFPTNFYQHTAVHRDSSRSSARANEPANALKQSRSSTKTYTISNSPTNTDHHITSRFGVSPARTPSTRTIDISNTPRLERSTSESVVNHISRSTSVRSTSVRPPVPIRSASNSSKASSFHETIHHYQTCPHTCPPKTRPLNVQPTVEHCTPSTRTRNQSTYSVIQGSCFDCDTAARRDAETEVLLRHTPEMSRLIAETRFLLSKFENGEFEQPSGSLPRQEGNDHDGHHDTDYYASQIHDLETRIEQLSSQRDKEVKRVWKGYTARWGPGTLGVTKLASAGKRSSMTSGVSAPPSQASRRDRSRDSTGSSGTWTTAASHGEDEIPEGRMRVKWIRDEKP